MGIKVLTGADVIEDWLMKNSQFRRLGLLTNPTGLNQKFQPTADVLYHLPEVKLAALFAVEHGIRGEKQAGVVFEDEEDSKLKVPVYSLYGQRRQPTEEMLKELDAIVFDIQDVGMRFYTYLTSLVNVMKACAAHDKAVIVLDRPNPLGGRAEGGLLQPGYDSTVGICRMPYRTGLTIGEFARYANDELSIDCELHVVKLQHWHRNMEYTDTGLTWLAPSPNLPTIESVRFYAGMCLFEGTNVSEGRGTTKPFELIGAPWIDGERLSVLMNELKLPGLHFLPTSFTPTFSKHEGELCHGVQCLTTKHKAGGSVTAALYLLHYMTQLYPQKFAWRQNTKDKYFVDLLSGADQVRTMVHKESGLQHLLSTYEEDEVKWEQMRQPYFIY